MSDRITVSTSHLDDMSSKCRQLGQHLQAASQELSSLGMNETIAAHSLTSGSCRLSGRIGVSNIHASDTASTVRQYSSALAAYDVHCQRLAKSIQTAKELFEALERMLSGQDSDNNQKVIIQGQIATRTPSELARDYLTGRDATWEFLTRHRKLNEEGYMQAAAYLYDIASLHFVDAANKAAGQSDRVDAIKIEAFQRAFADTLGKKLTSGKYFSFTDMMRDYMTTNTSTQDTFFGYMSNVFTAMTNGEAPASLKELDTAFDAGGYVFMFVNGMLDLAESADAMAKFDARQRELFCESLEQNVAALNLLYEMREQVGDPQLIQYCNESIRRIENSGPAVIQQIINYTSTGLEMGTKAMNAGAGDWAITLVLGELVGKGPIAAAAAAAGATRFVCDIVAGTSAMSDALEDIDLLVTDTERAMQRYDAMSDNPTVSDSAKQVQASYIYYMKQMGLEIAKDVNKGQNMEEISRHQGVNAARYHTAYSADANN